MNKARRQELKNLKYKKRLRLIGSLNNDTLVNPKGHNYNYTGFKNSSKPCSCPVCSPYKYDRAKVKKGLPLKKIFGQQFMDI